MLFALHRWMTSLNECSICNEPFVLNIPIRQALTLACGHTTCRSCLSRLQSPHCPSCRAFFASDVATMAPTYMLHEVFTSAAASTAAVSWHMHMTRTFDKHNHYGVIRRLSPLNSSLVHTLSSKDRKCHVTVSMPCHSRNFLCSRKWLCRHFFTRCMQCQSIIPLHHNLSDELAKDFCRVSNSSMFATSWKRHRSLLQVSRLTMSISPLHHTRVHMFHHVHEMYACMS